MIPTFGQMGSKVRIRKQLLELFPYSGRKYIEPFAGKGNVYFLAVQTLNYQQWILNDKFNLPFFQAIRDVNIVDLPDHVDETESNLLSKVFEDSPVAKVLEPILSYGSKGYKSGLNRGHSRYVRRTMIDKVMQAKSLLNRALIFGLDWEEFFKLSLSTGDICQEDFIYFDPPYFDTRSSYPNIYHYGLVELLNKLPCRWALSGYDNYLYRDSLEYKAKYCIQRNNELASRTVIETVWTNY